MYVDSPLLVDRSDAGASERGRKVHQHERRFPCIANDASVITLYRRLSHIILGESGMRIGKLTPEDSEYAVIRRLHSVVSRQRKLQWTMEMFLSLTDFEVDKNLRRVSVGKMDVNFVVIQSD